MRHALRGARVLLDGRLETGKALVLDGEFVPELPVFEPEVYFRPVDKSAACPCDLFSEEDDAAANDGPRMSPMLASWSLLPPKVT